MGSTTVMEFTDRVFLGNYSLNALAAAMPAGITSFAFTVMITSSVMAISLSAVKGYWELLLTISVIGALATLWFCTWLGRKVFKLNTEHYILGMFGMMTGTASTGLALLRGVDPNLETDVGKNLVLGSAIAAGILWSVLVL